MTLEATEHPFCYVTTTGRRSGRPHTIEIWFAAEGRTLYLLAEGRERADWVRNLRADPRAIVRLGEQRYPAVARLLEPGTAEDTLARRLVLAKFQAPGGHSLDRFGRTALAVALDVGEPSAAGVD